MGTACRRIDLQFRIDKKEKKPFLDDRRQRLFVFGQSGVYILLH
jgi:hypothetical protein